MDNGADRNERLRKQLHDLRALMSSVNSFLFMIDDVPLPDDLRQLHTDVLAQMETMKVIVGEMGKEQTR